MGRTAKYTEHDILDAALELLTTHGASATTVAAIARRLGAPSGSIYHRFASRDLLFATLWIRTVRRYQQGFLEALSGDTSQRATAGGTTREAAARAVKHTLEWTARHPEEATVLTMFRRDDLIAQWPDELGPELSTLNVEVGEALKRFTAQHCGTNNREHRDLVTFALITIPYSAVRQSMRGGRAPWFASAVLAASLAALDSGEPT